uniref:Transposase n=1 Tax=Panagrellus redivivus TaxID=6233 RepID=A0A7E5A203_PANRE
MVPKPDGEDWITSVCFLLPRLKVQQSVSKYMNTMSAFRSNLLNWLKARMHPSISRRPLNSNSLPFTEALCQRVDYDFQLQRRP